MIKTNYLKYVIPTYFLFMLLFKTYSQELSPLFSQQKMYMWELDSNMRGNKIRPDLLREKLEINISKMKIQKDTSGLIIGFIELADLDRWKGDYIGAFENLWKSLEMANATKDTVLLTRVHRNLGITYELLNQDSIALDYLDKSLAEAKKMFNQGRMRKEEIVHSLFSLSVFFRNNGQFDQANNYLDSCEAIYNDNRYMPYAEADRGYMALKQGKLDEAYTKLSKAHAALVEKNQRYQVVTYSFMGDLYEQKYLRDSAIYFYKKSLEKIDLYNAYVEIKGEVLQKLANIYSEKKQYQKAFRYISQSKAFSDSLFNTTNQRNSRLFEIRNQYQEKLKERQQKISEQEELITQKNKQVKQLIFGILLITALGALVYILFRYRGKIKSMKLQQKVKQEKNIAVLEVKNKELTSYALQSLEQEKSVKELLEIIKKLSPTDYTALKNKHVTSSTKMWEEFNLRFLKLNPEFYTKLQAQHPELSNTEQKHCALIKLNFDSKEMSKILNISLQSVHTSRYRIRKKTGLHKNSSLEAYISSF